MGLSRQFSGDSDPLDMYGLPEKRCTEPLPKRDEHLSPHICLLEAFQDGKLRILPHTKANKRQRDRDASILEHA